MSYKKVNRWEGVSAHCGALCTNLFRGKIWLHFVQVPASRPGRLFTKTKNIENNTNKKRRHTEKKLGNGKRNERKEKEATKHTEKSEPKTGKGLQSHKP